MSVISVTKNLSKRPWGTFEKFVENEKCTVKIIRVNPNSRLSLQYHNSRSEYWKVLSGNATAVLDRKIIILDQDDDLYVPVNTVHRLVGGKHGAVILEIAFGEFSEEDIVRIDDDYGREGKFNFK